jgi:hypothetical protein
MKKWEKWLKKHRRPIIAYSLIALVLVLLISLFFNVVKAAVVIITLIVINIFLRFYKRIIPGLWIELEITMFSSILCSIAYGFWPGLIVAIFSSVLAECFNQFISPFSLVNIVAYIIVSIVAIVLNPSTVVFGGLTLVVIANIAIFCVFVGLGYNLFKNLSFSITNLIWNYMLFTYLSVPILNLIM